MIVGIAKFICSSRITGPSSSIFKGLARPRSLVRSRPCISLLKACATNLSVRSVHNQPLRILFCGADELSITSLEALHRESHESPSNIASIEVVCRPGKPTGRGLKQIRHPPIKEAAERLGLPIHQIDTFTGWKLPGHKSDLLPCFDLIVAVSFGLLVPPRILNGTTYGGINLHPSLLPSFRGPAPLHWTILRGETHTGVTLQTLHPTQFDAGVVLDQTPDPGVPIPNPSTDTYADLQRMSAAMAAEMLVKAVRERSFVPPYGDVRTTRGPPTNRPHSFAPKIEPRMRYIDFQSMTSSHILRMNRAIAPLWAQARVGSDGSGVSVIFDPNMHLADMADSSTHAAIVVPSIEPGLPYTLSDELNHIGGTSAPLMINTIDRQTLTVPMLKMPGTPYRSATILSQRAGLLTKASQWDRKQVRTFCEPLKIPKDIREYVESLWNVTEKAT